MHGYFEERYAIEQRAQSDPSAAEALFYAFILHLRRGLQAINNCFVIVLPAGKKRKRQGSRCHPTSLYAQQATVPKSDSSSGRKSSVSWVVEVDETGGSGDDDDEPLAADETSFQPRVVFSAHLYCRFIV